MAQVSGNKIKTIQASKNLGTVIDNQVSGSRITNVADSRNRNKVMQTQVSGEDIMTNYMGINDAGMDIFHAKKISDNELNVKENPTAYDAKAKTIANANVKIALQEQANKDKNNAIAISIKSFTANVVRRIQEGDPSAAAKTKVADFVVDGGIAPLVFTFNTDKVNGKDNAKFLIATNTLTIGASPLTEGVYKVSVLVTDAKKQTKVLNITLKVLAPAK